MQKQSPLLRIWSWGKDEHVRLIGAGDHRYAGRREGAVLLSAVVKSLGMAGYAARLY